MDGDSSREEDVKGESTDTGALNCWNLSVKTSSASAQSPEDVSVPLKPKDPTAGLEVRDSAGFSPSEELSVVIQPVRC